MHFLLVISIIEINIFFELCSSNFIISYKLRYIIIKFYANTPNELFKLLQLYPLNLYPHFLFVTFT